MSKPLRCATCGDFIGVYTSFGSRKWHGECPGEGKHPKTERIEKKVGPGLYRRTNIYHASNTTSTWLVYRLKNKVLLEVLVILFGNIYDEPNKKWQYRW